MGSISSGGRLVPSRSSCGWAGRDRLLVRNDGERLERLYRQTLTRALVEQPPHPFVQLRLGHNLVAAGHFDELEAARAVVVALQRVQRRLDIFTRLVLEQLEQHLNS